LCPRSPPIFATPAKAAYNIASGNKVYLKIDGRMIHLWRAVDAEVVQAISFRQERTGSSEDRPSRLGATTSLRREPDAPEDL
jgi:hypothetical protein